MKTLAVASIATILILFPLVSCSSSIEDAPQGDNTADAASPSSDPPSTTPNPDCDPSDDVCVPAEPEPDPETNPDPSPEPTKVEVPLFIVGDCVTAACPVEAPYPVGCNVVFSPGDDRGCVASSPTESLVYFQAGDRCDEGLIVGTLYCSDTAGPALSLATCPINKPVPMHVLSSNMCPERD